MSTDNQQPKARPLFRKLAFTLAFVLFVLTLVFRFAIPYQGNFPVFVCLGLGFVMVIIGKTGNWPPKKDS